MDSLKIKKLDDGGCRVLKYLGSESEYIMPHRQDGMQIRELAPKSFAWSTGLKRLILPDGLVSVAEDAFVNCQNLDYVFFPDSITRVEHHGYSPNIFSKKELFDRRANTRIRMPFALLASYPLYEQILVALYFCENEEDFNVSDRANYHEFIYEWREKLLFYSIELRRAKTLKYLLDLNFLNVYNIDEFALQATRINDTAITSIILNYQNSYISRTALEAYRDGVLMEKLCGSIKYDWAVTEIGNGECRLDVYKGDESTLTLPTVYEGLRVTELSLLFSDSGNAKHLKSLSIPPEINDISGPCFYNCHILETVTMQGGREDIPDFAFYGVQSLKEVIIEDGAKTIGKFAFAECECLEKVYIPKSVTSIDETAFMGSDGCLIAFYDK